MDDLFFKLCGASGVSGHEEAVRGVILDEVRKYASCSVDRVGNVVAHKRGACTPKSRIMICTALDEPGFMISDATDDGFLRFTKIGNLDMRSAVGSRVVFDGSERVGVIGTKAVHLQTRAERASYPETGSLLIDIGARTRKEALSAAQPGDTAVFESEFSFFGGGLAAARAAGPRAGCLALIRFLRGELKYDCDFVFTSRGAADHGGVKAAAFALDPDIVVSVGAAPADDTPFSVSPASCRLGGGPLVSLADDSALYDPRLTGYALEEARRLALPVQSGHGKIASSAAGTVQARCGGLYALNLSLPCRYSGSPTEVVSLKDIDFVTELLGAVIRRAGEITPC